MPTSKVTRKGQVTIPQDIRETLGIREGDTVQIVLENDRVTLRRIVPWAELAGSLRHLAHLVPDDEAELKELVEAAWTAEAVERLGGPERPGGGEPPVDEQPPVEERLAGGEQPQ